MRRREFLKLSVASAAAAALSQEARAQSDIREIRIGYQKNGVLVIARQQAALEKHFASRDIGVKWVEFSSGPPMLEAMNVGGVDYGSVGDSPPIFAQSAGAAIVYAAGQPITNGQGILVQANSAIRSIADLKGKRVGFTKGSSAHNVIVQTLEKAGLTYADITPVYLTPPDAGPAFANGSIDAWSIWDPYFTIGLGIRPSLKKRSATPCWVAMMSSVIGPTAKDERLAATVWMSTGMPVTALSDLATSSRCDSAHAAVEVVTSMICCRVGPWLFAKSRLAI